MILYDKEFQKLDEFVFNIRSKTYNGMSLFSGATVSFMAVTVGDSGTTFGANAIDLSWSDYNAITANVIEDGSSSAASISLQGLM